MKKYHASCGQPDPPAKPTRPKPPLNSKPFCDCASCECEKCPDILKMLSITVTEHTCDFGSKGTKGKEGGKCPIHDAEDDSSLLDVIKMKEDCNCEVMARAVASNVHLNIGMSEQRAAAANAAANDKKQQKTTK